MQVGAPVGNQKCSEGVRGVSLCEVVRLHLPNATVTARRQPCDRNYTCLGLGGPALRPAEHLPYRVLTCIHRGYVPRAGWAAGDDRGGSATAARLFAT